MLNTGLPGKDGYEVACGLLGGGLMLVAGIVYGGFDYHFAKAPDPVSCSNCRPGSKQDFFS